MPLSFEASAEIQASPAQVWAVLIDVAQWPQWDPFCVRIEGQVALGAKIKAYTKLAPGRAFPVNVSTLEAERLMVWSHSMPLGLFKGVRSYRLEPQDHGHTRFTMREEFSGPLLPVIGRTIPDMTEAFDSFVQGLKQRAQQPSSSV